MKFFYLINFSVFLCFGCHTTTSQDPPKLPEALKSNIYVTHVQDFEKFGILFVLPVKDGYYAQLPVISETASTLPPRNQLQLLDTDSKRFNGRLFGLFAFSDNKPFKTTANINQRSVFLMQNSKNVCAGKLGSPQHIGWLAATRDNFSFSSYDMNNEDQNKKLEEFKKWLYKGDFWKKTSLVIAAPLRHCKEIQSATGMAQREKFLWARPAVWGAPRLLTVDDPKVEIKKEEEEEIEVPDDKSLKNIGPSHEDYEPGGPSSFSHTFSDAQHLFFESYSGFESHGEEYSYSYTISKIEHNDIKKIFELKERYAKIKLVGDLNNDGILEFVIEIHGDLVNRYILYQLKGFSLIEVMSMRLPQYFIE